MVTAVTPRNMELCVQNWGPDLGRLGRPRAALALQRSMRAASACDGLKGQYGKSVGVGESTVGYSIHVDDLDPRVLWGRSLKVCDPRLGPVG